MADEPEQNPWNTPQNLWKKLKPLAREKRTEPTEAEERLWQHLHNRQLRGVKLRRQHSIGQFIVDFYSSDHHLIIEVDGPIHQRTEAEDRLRQEYLEAVGLRVLRFTNDDVMNRIGIVLNTIVDSLKP